MSLKVVIEIPIGHTMRDSTDVARALRHFADRLEMNGLYPQLGPRTIGRIRAGDGTQVGTASLVEVVS